MAVAYLILILHRCASEACQLFKKYLRPARYYAILIGSEEKNNKNGFLSAVLFFTLLPPNTGRLLALLKYVPQKKMGK